MSPTQPAENTANTIRLRTKTATTKGLETKRIQAAFGMRVMWSGAAQPNELVCALRAQMVSPVLTGLLRATPAIDKPKPVQKKLDNSTETHKDRKVQTTLN
eukprot:1262007-Amphidinium_carterae.2